MSSRAVLRRTATLMAAVLVGVGITAIAVPASASDPCGPGSNPIVCENSKPGTPGWDVPGGGSSELQGFTTQISVDAGQSIDFKIKTTSTSYGIEIFRTGWYQGIGAREVASISPSVSLPQTQPECVWDVTTELTDCGNWAVSATWAVPADAVSGVYVADIFDDTNHWYSQIPFIVRNDSSHSDIVFQTSDPTWEAYNPYGGSDFYQGAANGRAYKISYNRPFVTRGDNSGRDFYFSAEYPMVRFLERNGYDVSYIAGVDTDRSGSLLLNHKTFLSVGHDEYWSANQRANVEAARDAGVNLAFFSGNEVYWHTRYEPSVAGSPTDYRTLVSYKETWSNAKIDPSDQWTGTWRDPRLASPEQGAGQPENALTGTIFMSNLTDLPVTVSSEEGKLRFWRNTGLDALPAGSSQALAPHTVGYESDETPDNGFAPPGLISMSTVSGEVSAELLDFGNVTGTAETTNHVTLYKAASGALVFASGSIQWSWGLDQTHDGDGAPADPRMQQATINLLADMGAQPATLMAGMVAATASTDTTGPTVAITSPTDGAAEANGASVTVTGTATDAGGQVAAVEVSTDGGATWHPATGTSDWTYTYVQSGIGDATVSVRATDDSANIGTPATVTLAVSCPCSIFGGTAPVSPSADDSTALELGLNFTPTADGYVTGVRFYKGAGNGGTHTGTLWSADGEALASVTFTDETGTGWQTATFAQPVPVVAGTGYVVSYTDPQGHYAVQNDAFWYRGINAPPLSVEGGYGKSAAGVFGTPGQFPTESFNSSQYYVDVTFAPAAETPLTLGGQTPLPGSSSVAVTNAISAVLSKQVTDGSARLAVTTAAGAPVAGSSAYAAATRTVTFTPTAPLAPATDYKVIATATGLSGSTSWSFRTAAADQVAGAQTVSFYDDSAVPTTLDENDPVPVTLGVRFTSDVAGTVSAVKFYKGPANTGTHVGALWQVGSSTPLAQATFTNESTQGWQTVTFATPVHIQPGTEYIASYRAPVGEYSTVINAFSGPGLNRGPLHTAADSGAFTYADGYPGSTSSTSYMVDVVFTADLAPLAVTSQSPSDGDLTVPTDSDVSLTVNRPLAAGASLAVTSASGAVTGTTTVSSDGTGLTFAPTAPLSPATVYTVRASGLVSTDGATLGDVTWSFTTVAQSPADGCPCTLFGGTAPASSAADDDSAVELGVSFVPSEDGQVTGVRFYKGTGNGGTHTGTLWSSSGVALRTVTFTGETATGWQTATFDTPVDVTAGTTYVVSYVAPQGHYAYQTDGFAADVTTGPLTAPAVGNGRYRYGGGSPTSTWRQTNYFVDVVFVGASGTDPSPSPSPSPTPTEPTTPVVVSVTPVAGSTGVPATSPVTATLSSAPASEGPSSTPSIALAAGGAAVAGTSSFDAAAKTVTFTPSAALPAGTTLSATVKLGSTVLVGGTWSFTTTTSQAPPAAVGMWADADAPSSYYDDGVPVQVGERFSVSRAGSATALKFYKDARNTGTHTLTLWGPDGALLASVPSTAESASGWQTVVLPQPVALTPGQTYTVAYQSAAGRYSATAGALTGPLTVGLLSSLANGGSYVYSGDPGRFPDNPSSAWYGVDVLFQPSS